ncbi:MAG: hypothetical protein LBV73_18700 [Paraburkholderia sp.]|nr:hypothetical protein [Paraburkholderia sp.]
MRVWIAGLWNGDFGEAIRGEGFFISDIGDLAERFSFNESELKYSGGDCVSEPIEIIHTSHEGIALAAAF